jgi:hypothetical protein
MHEEGELRTSRGAKWTKFLATERPGRSAEYAIRLLEDARRDELGALGRLLFKWPVFRVHQEIARRNPRLQGSARGIFCAWAQIVYTQANAAGVRRLASDSYEDGDLNLVRFLDLLIRDPERLWGSFDRHYRADAAEARAQASKETGGGWSKLGEQVLHTDAK